MVTSEQARMKWYRKTWGIILLLIFLPPLGVALAWTKPRWEKNTKWIVAAITAVSFIVLIAGCQSESGREASNEVKTQVPTKAEERVPEWKSEYESGLKYFDSYDYPEAIEQFDRALELNPDFQEAQTKKLDAQNYLNLAESWFSKGNTFVGQQRWLEAEEAYREAVRAYPDHVDARKKLDDIADKVAAIKRALEEDQYKKSSTTINYTVLEKDAEKLKGTRVHYRGKVFTIQESGGTTSIQLWVTPKAYGSWDDQIYVTYDGSINVYKDAIIEIWGEVEGQYSYESQAGWNITVPKVSAKYISG